MVGDSVVIEGVRTYVENTGSFLCQFYKKKKKSFVVKRVSKDERGYR